MAIRFQYQSPGLVAAYGAGQARARQRKRKYQLDALTQQQRHAQRMAELAARRGALGRRAGGGALGGGVINPLLDHPRLGQVKPGGAAKPPDVDKPPDGSLNLPPGDIVLEKPGSAEEPGSAWGHLTPAVGGTAGYGKPRRKGRVRPTPSTGTGPLPFPGDTSPAPRKPGRGDVVINVLHRDDTKKIRRPDGSTYVIPDPEGFIAKDGTHLWYDTEGKLTRTPPEGFGAAPPTPARSGAIPAASDARGAGSAPAEAALDASAPAGGTPSGGPIDTTPESVPKRRRPNIYPSIGGPKPIGPRPTLPGPKPIVPAPSTREAWSTAMGDAADEEFETLADTKRSRLLKRFLAQKGVSSLKGEEVYRFAGEDEEGDGLTKREIEAWNKAIGETSPDGAWSALPDDDRVTVLERFQELSAESPKAAAEEERERRYSAPGPTAKRKERALELKNRKRAVRGLPPIAPDGTPAASAPAATGVPGGGVMVDPLATRPVAGGAAPAAAPGVVPGALTPREERAQELAMRKLRVQQNAQARTAARKYRLGQQPTATDLLPYYVSPEEMEYAEKRRLEGRADAAAERGYTFRARESELSREATGARAVESDMESRHAEVRKGVRDGTIVIKPEVKESLRIAEINLEKDLAKSDWTEEQRAEAREDFRIKKRNLEVYGAEAPESTWDSRLEEQLGPEGFKRHGDKDWIEKPPGSGNFELFEDKAAIAKAKKEEKAAEEAEKAERDKWISRGTKASALVGKDNPHGEAYTFDTAYNEILNREKILKDKKEAEEKLVAEAQAAEAKAAADRAAAETVPTEQPSATLTPSGIEDTSSAEPSERAPWHPERAPWHLRTAEGGDLHGADQATIDESFEEHEDWFVDSYDRAGVYQDEPTPHGVPEGKYVDWYGERLIEYTNPETGERRVILEEGARRNHPEWFEGEAAAEPASQLDSKARQMPESTSGGSQNPWKDVASPVQEPDFDSFIKGASDDASKQELSQLREFYDASEDPEIRSSVAIIASPDSNKEDILRAVAKLKMKGVDIEDVLSPPMSTEEFMDLPIMNRHIGGP